MKLTLLQKRTCDIYFAMKKPNQAKAHKLAGSTMTGKTLREEAHKTLKKPQCVEYLDSLAQRATKRAERTADEVIRELEKLAFSNIRDFLKFSKKGVVLKDSNELTTEQMACLAEVSEYETKLGRKHIRFKLHDKKGALELLGRYHKLFTEKREVSANITVKIVHFNK